MPCVFIICNPLCFYIIYIMYKMGLPRWLTQWRIWLQCGRLRLIPGSKACPRKGMATCLNAHQRVHGQRSLLGYSPRSHKEAAYSHGSQTFRHDDATNSLHQHLIVCVLFDNIIDIFIDLYSQSISKSLSQSGIPRLSLLSPGSSVHGIFQKNVEWVAISSLLARSQSRDQHHL